MINTLYELYKSNPSNFKNQVLRKGLLGNPVSYKFSDEDFEHTLKVWNQIQNSEYENEFKSEVTKIVLIIKSIYDNLSRINRARKANVFLKYSIDTQLRMIIMYLEDQRRIVNEAEEREAQMHITGMSHLVANKESEIYPGKKYSAVENLEHQLVMIDDALPYLFYMDKIREGKGEEKDIICHIQNPEFEHFIVLSNLARIYKDAWEGCLYEDYAIQRITEDNVVVLAPENIRRAKVHYIAGVRREKRQVENVISRMGADGTKCRQSYKMIEKLALRFDFQTWESIFVVEQDVYERCNMCNKILVDKLKEELSKTSLKMSVFGGKLGDLLGAFEFLLTMSAIYLEILKNSWDQSKVKEYIFLCPEIDLEVLIQNFARLYHVKYEYASKLLRCFVYKNVRGKEMDLFSAPLVMLSNGHILFAPQLIQQINLKRKMEQVMLDEKVKRAELGIDYENKIRKQLGNLKNIQVYPKPIEFCSSLGNTDIDILVKLEDCLIVIEVKHVVTPYEPKRYYENHGILKKAAEQLKHRMKILETDWNRIKEITGDFLPNEKISNEKIIPLICINIENFTSMKYEGIPVLDESALLRFFESSTVTVKDNKQIFLQRKLWEGSTPTEKDFRNYVDNPVAVDWIEKTIVTSVVAVPRISDAELSIGMARFDIDEALYKKSIYGDKILN